MTPPVFCLSPSAEFIALMKLVKNAIKIGDMYADIASDRQRAANQQYKKAAETIAKAQKLKFTQRDVATAIMKSPAWVNRLLKWRETGYESDTPFGPQSKAQRARARVQAAKQSHLHATILEQESIYDIAAIEDSTGDENSATATESAASPFVAAASLLIDTPNLSELRTNMEPDFIEFADENTSRNRSDFSATSLTFNEQARARLIHTLRDLSVENAESRAAAALAVEAQRIRIGLPWGQLLVEAQEVVFDLSKVVDHNGRRSNLSSSPDKHDVKSATSHQTAKKQVILQMPDIPEFLRRPTPAESLTASKAKLDVSRSMHSEDDL